MQDSTVIGYLVLPPTRDAASGTPYEDSALFSSMDQYLPFTSLNSVQPTSIGGEA